MPNRLIHLIALVKKFSLLVWHLPKHALFRHLYTFYGAYRLSGTQGVRVALSRAYYQWVPHARTYEPSTKQYYKWIAKNEANQTKLESLEHEPLISIITPTYNSSPKYLKLMIESVLAQGYRHWELCIADDASTSKETLLMLDGYEKRDSRIKVIYRKTNGNISLASNSALALARGEYVAFLDHDDMLSVNALSSMVEKLNKEPHVKLIYSDEDKINAGNARYQPHFKSDWNVDMFFSQNYLGHLVLIEKSLVDLVGGFRVGYEGSQDYDLLLRCYEKIEDKEIGHIPKILYHWRAIEGSTALDTDAKPYTTQAGIMALKSYFDRTNQSVTLSQGALPNTYRVTFPIDRASPLVSILIPTRDHYPLLFQCITTLLNKTDYPNYEILILDNQSTQPEVLNYFKALRKIKNITIISYPHPFNFSAINNFGVTFAKGEIVVLLNNDVEIIEGNWLEEMVSHALRADIGAVGAMLYYPDETVQHAGVVMGIGGVAGHSHRYFPKENTGYFSRLKITQNYSAVTGACLVVEKRVYEEVGGLNATYLSVAFNDVDFCLKLQERGYRNLWTPYARLYHHESKSRGLDTTKAKKLRAQKEIAYMQKRWYKEIEEDKYYNKHLTRLSENFTLNS